MYVGSLVFSFDHYYIILLLLPLQLPFAYSLKFLTPRHSHAVNIFTMADKGSVEFCSHIWKYVLCTELEIPENDAEIYMSKFEENGVKISDTKLLTDADLQAMSVKKIAHRRIMTRVEKVHQAHYCNKITFYFIAGMGEWE